MILIVDDKPENIFSLKKLLELNGFEVDSALSGEEALKKILKGRDALIILDVQMPGMDGVELARHIRAWAGRRPMTLVAVTGLDDDRTRLRTANAGFDLHFTKPADPDKLAILLADIVIRQNQSSDSTER